MTIYNVFQLVLLGMQITCFIAGIKTKRWGVWLPCVLILMVGVIILGAVK